MSYRHNKLNTKMIQVPGWFYHKGKFNSSYITVHFTSEGFDSISFTIDSLNIQIGCKFEEVEKLINKTRRIN